MEDEKKQFNFLNYKQLNIKTSNRKCNVKHKKKDEAKSLGNINNNYFQKMHKGRKTGTREQARWQVSAKSRPRVSYL